MSRCVVQKALPSHLWLLRYCFLSGEPDDRTTSSKGAAHDCKWTCPNDCPMLLQYIGRSYATTCSNKTHLQHHNFQGTCFFFQKMEDMSPLQRPPQERKPELGFLGKAGDHRKIPTSPSKKMVFRFVPMDTDGRSQGFVCIYFNELGQNTMTCRQVYLCLVELGDSFQTLLSLRLVNWKLCICSTFGS